MLSRGHDMAVRAHSSCGLYKTHTGENRYMIKRGSYWWLMASGGGQVTFLQECDCWKLVCAPVDGPTPRSIWATLAGLIGMRKREYLVGREMCCVCMGTGEIQGEMEYKVDMIKIYCKHI